MAWHVSWQRGRRAEWAGHECDGVMGPLRWLQGTKYGEALYEVKT